MGKAILITGTDTGAGKTYVTCLLGRRLVRQGISVRPLKPVESGCLPGRDGRPHPADAAALCAAVSPGLPLSEICLYPLSAPLSPHLAARLERETVDPARIREAVTAAADAADVVLVEGAGGILVEMAAGYSFADLARELSMPVLVVAEDRLGVLNHLALTWRFLGGAGISRVGAVLNERSLESFPAREFNEAEVRRIVGDRYLGKIPYGAAELPEELFRRIRMAGV
jgi:dethiobiotin synthetase